jgi:hypothetical protein
VKRSYGAFKSAVRRSWGFSTDNGITDVKLKYDSAYENSSAVEAFVYRLSGDKALLVGYDIMTPETAKKPRRTRKPNGTKNEKPKKKSAKPSAKRASNRRSLNGEQPRRLPARPHALWQH